MGAQNGGQGGGQYGGQGGGQYGSQPGSFSNGVQPNANTRIGSDAVSMAMDTSSTQSSAQAGLQLGPPERWWDEKKFKKALDLRPDQQRQLDAIFNAAKPTILQHYQAVVQEQDRLDLLCHQSSPDEASLFAEIDRLAAVRADLEKANAHLLLTLRQGLDAKQIERLKTLK